MSWVSVVFYSVTMIGGVSCRQARAYSSIISIHVLFGPALRAHMRRSPITKARLVAMLTATISNCEPTLCCMEYKFFFVLSVKTCCWYKRFPTLVMRPFFSVQRKGQNMTKKKKKSVWFREIGNSLLKKHPTEDAQRRAPNSPVDPRVSRKY